MSLVPSVFDPENLNMIIQPERTSVINGGGPVQKMLHEEIEIKCFYEGSSTLLIGSETVTAKAGDVVVINPYELHATVNCDGARGKYHLFMVPLDFFTGCGIEELELRSLLLAKRKAFKTFFENDGQLYSILCRIILEYKEKESAFRAAIRGLVTELFAVLLRRGLKENGLSISHSDMLRSYQLIEPALGHIRRSYSEPLTTDLLAEECRISKYYFCRVFKTVTSKTAMEYLRDYRMRIADVMLTNTDESITRIAESCGFDDVNYFCRCYKNHYGISPGRRRTKSI